MSEKVLRLPGVHSNAYRNLVRFIAIADTAKVLRFYMDSIWICLRNGYITEHEADDLMEQGEIRMQAFR